MLNSRLMYLRSQELAAERDIVHGFFTRLGGVSDGIFATLNCGGRDSAEPAAIVDENRHRVALQLGIQPSHLLGTRQVHSSTVVTVERPWDFASRPEADAMVTSTPGLGLGILTADCAPVLFADATGRVIGAAHSGWKGAVAGVLQATVNAMEQIGAKRERIVAAIGPTIAQASYEVDASFRERFVQSNHEYATLFTEIDESGHCRFDLPTFVSMQLAGAGIGRIETLGNDTYAEEQNLFSFRRSVHRKEPDYGRQISVIALQQSPAAIDEPA